MENEGITKAWENVLGADTVQDELIESLLTGINDGVSDQDKITRDELTDEIYQRRKRLRINKTIPGEAPEPKGLARGYTFENALEEFDPTETQPQVNEFWKYTSRNLNGQGRF